MDHTALRKKVNDALKRKELRGITADTGEKITSGLSSGSMLLNMALSGSPFIGYVWGRLGEIYGEEGTGKSSLALHAIFEAQKLEKISKIPVPCLLIDMEASFDPRYAEAIGIDLKSFTIAQEDCAENALNSVEESIKAGYKLVIVDSVAALTPMAEIEGEAGSVHMGLQARLMSQACRKLTGLCHKKGVLLLFINQTRQKIGIVFGSDVFTPGGKALKFYSTYRLELRAPRKGAKQVKSLMGFGKEEEMVEIGTTVNIKVVKNKVFPPYRKASVFIKYGEGIDRFQDAVDFLVYAGAFKPVKKKDGKTTEVLSVPCKGKRYTASKVLQMLREDADVQQDVIQIVKDIDGGIYDSNK